MHQRQCILHYTTSMDRQSSSQDFAAMFPENCGSVCTKKKPAPYKGGMEGVWRAGRCARSVLMHRHRTVMPPACHWNAPRVSWSALIDAEPAANAEHSKHCKDCAAASNGPATCVILASCHLCEYGHQDSISAHSSSLMGAASAVRHLSSSAMHARPRAVCCITKRLGRYPFCSDV